MRVSQAERARDALGKTIYVNLHGWLVQQINKKIESNLNEPRYIGILDMPGFGNAKLFPGFLSFY